MLILLAALQIEWKADLDAALAEAKKTGRPVLLHFYKANSTAFERMARDTFGHPEIGAFSAKTFVHVRLDVGRAASLVEKHRVSELPFTVLLTSAGERFTALPGYQGPEGFKEAVEGALAAWAKLAALKPEQHAEAAGLYEELNEGRKAGAAWRRAAKGVDEPRTRGGFLVKAFDQLNRVDADEAVTTEILELASELEALDPALGFGDDAAYARAMADYNREDWDEAIKKLEGLAAKFPEGDRVPYALLGAADLYHHAKKDHKTAIERAQRVVDKYPQGGWAERARHMIEHIKVHAEREK